MTSHSKGLRGNCNKKKTTCFWKFLTALLVCSIRLENFFIVDPKVRGRLVDRWPSAPSDRDMQHCRRKRSLWNKNNSLVKYSIALLSLGLKDEAQVKSFVVIFEGGTTQTCCLYRFE